MRRRSCRVVLLTACVVASSGCFVSSLHPVYDDKTIVFDEALLGVWENRESEVSAAVTRGEWRSYQVAFTDRFGTTRYHAHLTSIPPARFLNILPEGGLEQPPFIITTSGFVQIEIEGGSLRVREPDYAVVLERAKAGKLGVAAAIDIKQNVLVTAETTSLRRWLARSLKDEALWADWKTFTRSTQ